MKDARKKAQFERRAVIGLLVLFLCTAFGALRNMGIIGQRTKAAPMPLLVEGVHMSGSLGEALNTYREKFVPQPEPMTVTKSKRVVDEEPPGYTAQDLRDPLQALLPSDEFVAVVPGEEEAPEAFVPSLEELNVHVQGLIWGGSKPRAIINDRVYEVGQSVDGVMIVAIDWQGVTIEHEGRAVKISTVMSPASATRGYVPPRMQRR